MAEGRVEKFFPERGFGFLRSFDGRTDVFVHIGDVEGQRLTEDDRVSFDYGTNPRDGRVRAVNVRRLE